MTEIVELFIPALAGGLATILLLLIFPDIRQAKINREQAETEKMNAAAETDRLDGFGEFVIKMADGFQRIAETLQVSAEKNTLTLQQITTSNISMFEWMQTKDKEYSTERKVMIDQINELSQHIKQLQLEKDDLEETLESASIEIVDINNKRAKERDECAEKIVKVKGERDKLIKEREVLLSQFIEKVIPSAEILNEQERTTIE